MKCTECLYEDNCSLKDIAKDITGCEGHSKVKPPKEGQIQCSCCKRWCDKKNIFVGKEGKHNLCFYCY